MKQRNQLPFIYILSHVLIGIGFFFLYVYHVRAIFENRTNFNHRSKLGRESLLREDSLYFSFYKTIVEADEFWTGFDKLTNTTSIEYPSSVNVIHRFHVFPEIFIGYLYHSFKEVTQRFGAITVSCWAIDGMNGRDPIISCDGIGEPFFFYLEFVWILGGLTVFIIYMYGSFLSENSFGGIYAVVLYIIFHKNASKIYERPLARENFAFPFIFWQIFYLTLCIQRCIRSSSVNLASRIAMVTKLTFLTTISLLCWEFASVIYATQILIMIAPWSLGLFSSWFCIDYTISQFLSNFIAYYLSFQNKKYFLAWQNGPAFALLFVNLVHIYKSRTRTRAESNEGFSMKNIMLGLSMACSGQGIITDILEKSGFAKPEDNPYSVYRDILLHWSLQRKANFTTTLYACNPSFNEIKIEDYWELIKTLFVKPYVIYGVVLLAKFLRKRRSSAEPIENKEEQIERAKKYVLEDFFENNRISMQEMTNKETEKDLNECLKLLEQCNYNYEKYKVKKSKMKKQTSTDHEDFIKDVKKLKDQINENEKRKEEQKVKVREVEKGQTTEDNNDSTSHRNTENSATAESSGGCAASAEPKVKEAKNTKSPTTEMLSRLGYHYLYSVVQMCVFSIIGITVKKLFFLCYTMGCVIAPTLCSKFWYRKQNNIFWTISLLVFLTSIFDPGLQNLEEEYLPNQPDAEELEQMLEWINLNTEKDAVFGGPIEVIATVHLSTKRPIVNHPHLEMRQISERTEGVYSVFSRQQSSEIYNQCSNLKIQYLIVSFHDCINTVSGECDILAIWDSMQPNYRKYPQFCSELATKNIPSFLKVFSNKHYSIVKMFSQSVQLQLNLRQNKLPEKGM